MKSRKVYLIVGSLCLALVIAVLPFVAGNVVSALTPALQPNQALAATQVTHESEPLVGSNFGLEFDGKLVGYFTECGGLGSENFVVEHRVVDKYGNELIQKIPGRLKWTNIVLKRGITSDMSMWDWRRLVEQGMINDARVNGAIIMFNQEYVEIARWNFQNGWPVRITGPCIDAQSNEYAVEEVEIVHEGLERVTR